MAENYFKLCTRGYSLRNTLLQLLFFLSFVVQRTCAAVPSSGQGTYEAKIISNTAALCLKAAAALVLLINAFS
jgi:hypothetical protein